MRVSTTTTEQLLADNSGCPPHGVITHGEAHSAGDDREHHRRFKVGVERTGLFRFGRLHVIRPVRSQVAGVALHERAEFGSIAGLQRT
jgi:hypothetical protein